MRPGAYYNVSADLAHGLGYGSGRGGGLVENTGSVLSESIGMAAAANELIFFGAGNIR
jgi:hypothetical protein